MYNVIAVVAWIRVPADALHYHARRHHYCHDEEEGYVDEL